ncbi:hypothetical protein BDV97DRAFT_100079 [Delphinella strobiligena]|nr:hypothetical protein BDV97DRAFT_100079 [Delphinella strobiligena]
MAPPPPPPPPPEPVTPPLWTYPPSSHQEIHVSHSKVSQGLKYLILLGPPGAPSTALSTRISSAHFPTDHLLPSSPYASRLLDSTRAMRRAPRSMDAKWCRLSIDEGVRDADPSLLVGALCEQVKEQMAHGDGVSERCFVFEDFPRNEEGCRVFEDKFGPPDYILILNTPLPLALQSFLSSHPSTASTTTQVFEKRYAEFCADIPAVEMRYKGILGRVDVGDGDVEGDVEALYQRVKGVLRGIDEGVVDDETGLEVGGGIEEGVAGVRIGGGGEGAA